MKILKALTKEEIFSQVREWLTSAGYEIVNSDDSRPWGGFFVIEEGQIERFRSQFFHEVSFSEAQLKNKLSPKILLVAPESRLSWQYHFRRAEVWKLVAGEGGIVRSDTDEEGQLAHMMVDKVVELRQGERHRLVGLQNWGVVAEIWMHTDPENPSDETDIVRVQDDFHRQ
jgi:mannose-6-phosphate isomerase-like protein (cupin superfamily)